MSVQPRSCATRPVSCSPNLNISGQHALLFRCMVCCAGLCCTCVLMVAAAVCCACGLLLLLQEFKIQNIVGSCDVKFPIRLEGLSMAHGYFATVSSAQGPWLSCMMLFPAGRQATWQPCNLPLKRVLSMPGLSMFQTCAWGGLCCCTCLGPMAETAGAM